jgi:hypothetical protein
LLKSINSSMDVIIFTIYLIDKLDQMLTCN